ncbi:unnamed protein product, partial [Brenthis ino]
MASACASGVDNTDNSLVTLDPVDTQPTETAVMCKETCLVHSEDYKDPQQVNLNIAATTGIIACGIGYSTFEELCSSMNIPSFSSKYYLKLQNDVYAKWEKTASESLAAAAAKEKEIALAEGRTKNAKFIGGKRTNFALKGGYQGRCHAAAVSFNSRAALSAIQKAFTEKNPGGKVEEVEKKKALKRKYNVEHPTRKKEIKRDTKTK